MRHFMKLKPDPFLAIAMDKKQIELRVNDEKRRRIREGDQIVFTRIPKGDYAIFVEVTKLHVFPSFKELYDKLDLKMCGYTDEEISTATPSDMDQYYTPEEQARFGVVGIEFRHLENYDLKKDSDMLRTSRFLSLVLRHKPEAAGITVDEHGWANVDALIAGVNNKYPLNMELLETIVWADEKDRYSFNEAHTQIRANQGHSIPVDVELKEVRPPEVLYHGTGEKYVPSINKEGLVPKSRLYVHLSADKETAKKVGARHGKPVIYAVLAEEMAADGFAFYLSENNVWLTKSVPVKYLRKDTRGGYGYD